MRATQSSAGEMKLIGGRLCLDFVNTVGGRKSESPRRKSLPATNQVLGDKLESYSDLVEWSRHAGIFTAAEAVHLIKESKRNVAAAGAVLDRAIAMREALYRICKAAITGGTPRSIDLEIVNDELLQARSHERLIGGVDGLSWEWVGSKTAIDRMLWSISQSAAEFLTTGDLSRLRECPGEECGWLFEDTSRNRSRQWCHMQDCGNLAKVRRFRTRLASDGKS
jgi:predicted RNA-binding Zn ribbon-like protein